MHLLVASDGKLWDIHAVALRRHLGYFGGSTDLVRFATGNFGFAFVILSADQARLRLRSDMFTKACFEAVASLLVRINPRRIIVEIDDEQTVSQMFDTIYDTVAYLDLLRLRGPEEVGRPVFFSEQLALERIHGARRESLLRQFRRWRRLRGELDARHLQAIKHRPIGAEQLFARITKSGQVASMTWPHYMDLYAPEDVPGIIGKPFDEHPDAGYLKSAAGGYVETRRRNAPMLELVEAALSPPNGPPRRVRYERLLLPWLGDGEVFVSSISFLRSRRVTLPPAPALALS
jgi:hypothetical protein